MVKNLATTEGLGKTAQAAMARLGSKWLNNKPWSAFRANFMINFSKKKLALIKILHHWPTIRGKYLTMFKLVVVDIVLSYIFQPLIGML